MPRRGRAASRGGLAVLALVAAATSAADGRAADPPAPIQLSSGWLLQDAALVADAGSTISSLGYMPAIYTPAPYSPPPTANANPPGSPGENAAARPKLSSAWRQAPGPQAKAWYRATVPGTVLTTLLNNQVYPEPLYGENNRPSIIPESLARASYWYRTVATVPRTFGGRTVWLNFDGINYLADVWVNGLRVGDIRGAFIRGRFDITALVTPGQPAAIAAQIKPPLTPADPAEQTQQWGLGLNGGLMSHDGPTFVASQGWDWTPAIRDRNAGIWQPVTLSATGAVVVRDPYVMTHVALPARDRADVTIDVTVENASDRPSTGKVTGRLGRASFASSTVTLRPRESRVVRLSPADIRALTLSQPRLWWPNGFGEPYLYPLHLAFETPGGVSDAIDLNVGVRDVAYKLGDSDTLTLVVNGVPVFAKGGNWGMDEAMKRMPRERLDAAMRLHRDAHFTIVRNWVGQSTSEDFYDLADRYGLMVWDEFFQPAAGLDSGRQRGEDGELDVTDVPMYLANARDKVLRFRNHPSIVLWCGRNEGEPSPRALADGLKTMMAELDPTRFYQSNSDAGRGVRSGGPYAWQPPAAYYGEGPGGRRPLTPFKTEIGSVSIPTIEAIRAMMPASDLEPFPNDDWAEHDFATGGGNNSAAAYLRTIAARYGDISTLAGFVRAAQMANYEALRALYEGRFAKLFAPATAVITWMSHPAQPSFTWQLYSYDLEPFGSYFGAKKACEALHIEMNQQDFHVLVVNHLPSARQGLTYRTQIFYLDGTRAADRTADVAAVPASGAADLGAIDFPAALSPVHFVSLELLDGRGSVLSSNFYWRNGADENDLTALDTMPIVPLQVSSQRRDSGSTVHLDVTLRNDTPHVALLAHLQLRRRQTGARVLPVWYSDNYVSLRPGETRTIAIDAALADLGGDEPIVSLDGWNVERRATGTLGA